MKRLILLFALVSLTACGVREEYKCGPDHKLYKKTPNGFWVSVKRECLPEEAFGDFVEAHP